MNKIGDIRSSQLIFTFGVGSLIDLPNFSALVMGLDDWDSRQCTEITEDRLLTALKRRFGPLMDKLYLPPLTFDDTPTDGPEIGVPVAPFPRWLRCPLCDTLATIESGIFELVRDRWRPDKTCYVHGSCTPAKGSNPTALPVRFLLACREGHLTDFPWIEYAHYGGPACKPSLLTLREYGAAGDASDIIVKCTSCGSERRMGDAFDRDKFAPACPGHHPHLRRFDAEPCQEEARPILLGASNSWFPLVMSALSIPRAADHLAILVEEHWKDLKDIPSLDVAKYVTAASRMPALVEFSAEDIWAAIQVKRQASTEEVSPETDLLSPEWDVLIHPHAATVSNDFEIAEVAPPHGYEHLFQKTVVLEKVREVRALFGFTRIESKGDFVDAAVVDDRRETRLCRNSPTWLPASEVRGEGIFLQFCEDVLHTWETSSEVRRLEQAFLEAHCMWRTYRKQYPPDANFPGIRYVLIHSLSHALMRQISLECGYTGASLRERLYCKTATSEHGPMAGILIYTAASDSEGTLGGLVALGQPASLGRHIQQAMESMRLCASDPLCSDHLPEGNARGIHGACCHACLFAPETSCELGNRYLDRNVLVETFSERGTSYISEAAS